MKRESFRGTGKVFQFSLKQTCFSKSWLFSTIFMGVLLIVACLPTLLTSSKSDSKEKEEEKESLIEKIFYCDETEGEVDYSVLSEIWENPLSFEACGTMEEAISMAEETEHAISLEITQNDSGFHLMAALPEDSELGRFEAEDFVTVVQQNFSLILMQKAQISATAIFSVLSTPIHTDVDVLHFNQADMDEQPQNLTQQILSTFIPFLMMMLLYFMVMFYGQSTANSVISEKNTKLIETMMTAVSPLALILGKLFASAVAAIIQILVWIVSIFLGAYVGAWIVLSVTPDSATEMVLMVDSIIQQDGILSVGGICLTILLLFLGFLLYLSLSALGGALASNPEDLGKTNGIFVIIIVMSLFLCVNFNDLENEMIRSALWLRVFPFTSVMTLSGDMILGKASLPIVFIAFAVLALSIFALIALAARIYKMLILYRGKVPSLKMLIKMGKESKERQEE